MKKVYLHMGFHKTATTSFQSTCEMNLDLLLSQGYLYPSLKHKRIKKGKAQFNHSGPIVSCFGPDSDAHAFNLESKNRKSDLSNISYLKQLKSYLLFDKNLMISGEAISSLDIESLRKLRDFLESKGAVIVPLACVRSPYSFHCSVTQTIVKRGTHVNFLNLAKQKACITKIQSVFKDIEFVSFNTACAHPKGPVGYLLEHCGINITGFSFDKRNLSRSNAFVRLQNAINKQQPFILDRKLNPKHFQLHPVSGGRFLLTKEELSSIQADLDRENQFFEEYLGAEFCDRELKTSDVFSLESLVCCYPEFFTKKINSSRTANLLNAMGQKFKAKSGFQR